MSEKNIARAIKIPTDGPVREVMVEVDYRSIGTYLNAQHVEIVRAAGFGSYFHESGDHLVFVTDEDGLAKQLPRNMRAGYLYGSHINGHPIVGDVLVVHEGLVTVSDGRNSYQDMMMKPLPLDVTVNTVADFIIHAAMSKSAEELVRPFA